MSDQPIQPPLENTARGTVFALAAIPIAIVLFAIVGSLGGAFGAVVAAVVPHATAYLYRRGSGGLLGKASWPRFIIISAAAVILGIFAALVARSYAAFQSVGGDGGLFSPVFWRTFGRHLTGSEDTLFATLIGLGLGIIGIVSVIRAASKTVPSSAPTKLGGRTASRDNNSAAT